MSLVLGSRVRVITNYQDLAGDFHSLLGENKGYPVKINFSDSAKNSPLLRSSGRKVLEGMVRQHNQVLAFSDLLGAVADSLSY